MMRDAIIDVTYEVEVSDDVSCLADPAFHRAALEHMREKADRAAEAVGGRVRTDRPPQVAVPRMASPASPLLQGQQFVLMASRWHVEVPVSWHGDGR